MIEEYIVETIGVSESNWPPVPSKRRAITQEEDVNAFLDADGAKQIAGLLREYSNFFSNEPEEATSTDDIKQVRSMLIRAHDLSRLASLGKDMEHPREPLTPDSLRKAGLTVTEFGRHDEIDGRSIASLQKTVRAYFPLEAEGNAGAESPARHILSLGDSLVNCTFRYDCPSEQYGEFLKAGLPNATMAGCKCTIGEKGQGVSLEIATGALLGAFNATDEGLRQCVSSILDALFAIHLHDIGMRTRGGILYQSSNSLVSSLWYCFVDSLREGRLGRCKVCAKPFIASKERGSKRVYCSQACSKKYQRIERFYYLIEKGETREKAAKAAKISLKAIEKYEALNDDRR